MVVNYHKLLNSSDGMDTLSKCQKEVVTTKTAATSVGIPYPHTIAIKSRKPEKIATNVLINIVKKGVLLPASGKERLALLAEVSGDNPESKMSIDIYHNEGANKIALNQNIGSFKITGADLDKGLKLKEGDEVIFHWNLSDNGSLQVEIECPSIGKSFAGQNFYVPQDDHQNFDIGKEVRKINYNIDRATNELAKAQKIVSDDEYMEELDEIGVEIITQSQRLENVNESDEIRYISERIRNIRRRLDTIIHSPKNRKGKIENYLERMDYHFSKYVRGIASEETIDNFDRHRKKAIACLEHSDDKHLDQYQEHVREMKKLMDNGLVDSWEYQELKFHTLSEKLYLVSDKKRFLRAFEKGKGLLEDKSIGVMRRVISAMEDMIDINNSDEDNVSTAPASVRVLK